MSSNSPPQLHLTLPGGTTSFKRSFEQFGFDLETPRGNLAQGSGSRSNDNDRNKRARSSETSDDDSSDASYETSPTSPDAGPSGSTIPSISEGSNVEGPSFGRPVVLNQGPTGANSTTTSDRSASILSFPLIEDVEMPHYSTIDLSRPPESPGPRLSSSGGSLSDGHDSFMSSLERFSAFDNEISALRVSHSPSPVVRESTPPPILPPINFGDHSRDSHMPLASPFLLSSVAIQDSTNLSRALDSWDNQRLSEHSQPHRQEYHVFDAMESPTSPTFSSHGEETGESIHTLPNMSSGMGSPLVEDEYSYSPPRTSHVYLPPPQDARSSPPSALHVEFPTFQSPDSDPLQFSGSSAMDHSSHRRVNDISQERTNFFQDERSTSAIDFTTASNPSPANPSPDNSPHSSETLGREVPETQITPSEASRDRISTSRVRHSLGSNDPRTRLFSDAEYPRSAAESWDAETSSARRDAARTRPNSDEERFANPLIAQNSSRASSGRLRSYAQLLGPVIGSTRLPLEPHRDVEMPGSQTSRSINRTGSLISQLYGRDRDAEMLTTQIFGPAEPIRDQLAMARIRNQLHHRDRDVEMSFSSRFSGLTPRPAGADRNPNHSHISPFGNAMEAEREDNTAISSRTFFGEPLRRMQRRSVRNEDSTQTDSDSTNTEPGNLSRDDPADSITFLDALSDQRPSFARRTGSRDLEVLDRPTHSVPSRNAEGLHSRREPHLSNPSILDTTRRLHGSGTRTADFRRSGEFDREYFSMFRRRAEHMASGSNATSGLSTSASREGSRNGAGPIASRGQPSSVNLSSDGSLRNRESQFERAHYSTQSRPASLYVSSASPSQYTGYGERQDPPLSTVDYQSFSRDEAPGPSQSSSGFASSQSSLRRPSSIHSEAAATLTPASNSRFATSQSQISRGIWPIRSQMNSQIEDEFVIERRHRSDIFSQFSRLGTSANGTSTGNQILSTPETPDILRPAGLQRDPPAVSVGHSSSSNILPSSGRSDRARDTDISSHEWMLPSHNPGVFETSTPRAVEPERRLENSRTSLWSSRPSSNRSSLFEPASSFETARPRHEPQSPQFESGFRSFLGESRNRPRSPNYRTRRAVSPPRIDPVGRFSPLETDIEPFFLHDSEVPTSTETAALFANSPTSQSNIGQPPELRQSVLSRWLSSSGPSTSNASSDAPRERAGQSRRIRSTTQVPRSAPMQESSESESRMGRNPGNREIDLDDFYDGPFRASMQRFLQARRRPENESSSPSIPPLPFNRESPRPPGLHRISTPTSEEAETTRDGRRFRPLIGNSWRLGWLESTRARTRPHREQNESRDIHTVPSGQPRSEEASGLTTEGASTSEHRHESLYVDRHSNARQNPFLGIFERDRDRERRPSTSNLWGTLDDTEEHRLPNSLAFATRRRRDREPSTSRPSSNEAGSSSQTSSEPRTSSGFLSRYSSHNATRELHERTMQRNLERASRARASRFGFHEDRDLILGDRPLPNFSLSNFSPFRRRERTMGDYMRDEDFDSSYEGLLSLANTLGEVKSRAVPEHIISSLPKGFYKDWVTNDSDRRCPICLDDYIPSDPVLKLTNCLHWLHKECLEQWLRGANTCPVCRKRVKSRREYSDDEGPSGSSNSSRRDEDDDEDGENTSLPPTPPWRAHPA